nr:11130_t:CDS:2 [Entrophospora candida]
MGKLLWSQWGRLIALTAGVFEIVGGVFGIFYRLSTFEQFTGIFNPLILKFNYLAISCM